MVDGAGVGDARGSADGPLNTVAATEAEDNVEAVVVLVVVDDVIPSDPAFEIFDDDESTAKTAATRAA